MVAEYLDRENYAVYVSMMNLFSPISGIWMVFYYSYINNYNFLFILFSLSAIVINYLSWIYICESPHWLVAKNNIVEYKKVLTHVATVNNCLDRYEKKINLLTIKIKPKIKYLWFLVSERPSKIVATENILLMKKINFL